MIDRDHFMPVNFFKKEAFTGSERGMRFMVRKQEDVLEAYVWPEPYGFAATPDEQKQRAEFEFNPEGILSAVDWINERREADTEMWDKLARK